MSSEHPRDVCSVEVVCWETARLTPHMTTTEEDNDTGTHNHRKHELALWWLTILPGWVNNCSTPVPTTVGRQWVAQQHYPHHSLFNTKPASALQVFAWTSAQATDCDLKRA